MPPKENPKKEDLDKLQQEVKQDVTDEIEKKKVIYAELDDEVTTIYDKIKPLGHKQIYVVVPKRAIIFQSAVNLKILKRKAEDDDKKIFIVTNDSNGIYLAQQVGITVYNKANEDGKPALFSSDTNDEKLMITPLKAAVNSVKESTPMRMTEKRISISEILGKKKKGRPINVTNLEKTKLEVPKKKKNKPKFVIVAPNRHALISMVVVSLVILLVIVYIALPGVTIYVTPAATVLEKSVNITLADYTRNRSELDTRPHHMIASYPIETTVTKTLTHYATGKKFSEKGANASGKILITNTSNISWPLVPETRFQVEEGIVFRIKDSVTVPPAGSNGPGTVEAHVIADQLDAYNAIVGERGNIAPSRFFLPGLRDDSRSKLFAESSEPMVGGVTDYISFIAAEDVEASKSRMKDALLKDAADQLKTAVIKQGELVDNADAFMLLEGDGAIVVGEVSINVPGGLEGQQIKEFNVTGEVKVSGVYYGRQEMLEILKNELLLKKSPQKELLRINDDSTSYRIFEWDKNAKKIKLTANIKGIEQFTIQEDKENGVRLIKKIKDHIVGREIDEAKVFIQNLPEINKVEIDSWPAWSPTIPNLPDNIDFEIRDAVEVQ